jgi:hypothetical protein
MRTQSHVINNRCVLRTLRDRIFKHRHELIGTRTPHAQYIALHLILLMPGLTPLQDLSKVAEVSLLTLLLLLAFVSTITVVFFHTHSLCHDDTGQIYFSDASPGLALLSLGARRK